MSLFQFLFLQSVRFRRIKSDKSEVVSYLESKGFIRYDIRRGCYVVSESGKSAASDFLTFKVVAWIALALSVIALIRTI